MRLEKFKIQNFRSIQRLEINCEESNILTLIGSISVGKSNVLRSLELFWNDSIYEQEIQSLQDRLFYSEIQQRTQETKIEGEWCFNCTNETVDSVQFEETVLKDFLHEYKPAKIILKFAFDPSKDKKPARWIGWLPSDPDQDQSSEEYRKNGHGINWLVKDPYSQYAEDFHLDLGSKLIYRFRAEWDINVELYLKKIQEKPQEKKSLENLISRVLWRINAY